MRIKITADSTCDLSPDLIEQYHIGITPLYIVNEDGAFKDGEEIHAEDVYAYAKRTGRLCSTSAVSMADYYTYWKAWQESCDAVIHLSLSSELSSTYTNACLAASELGNVWVVDTRNLCTGSGLLAIEAAEMAERGMEPEQIVEALKGLIPKVCVSFVLNTLQYLRRGGRCTPLTALGANLLGIKPCIEVHDGIMSVGKKYRGKPEYVHEQYIRDRLSDDWIDTRRLVIADSGMTPEGRARLERIAASCKHFDRILHTQAGCTISSHCGPNCMGVIYLLK